MKIQSEERLMRPDEAAKYLQVSESSLRHWVMDRKITFTKIHRQIRFRRKWLDEMIEKGKREVL